MSAFDQLRNHPLARQPLRPVWRIRCRCWFRPGAPGEVAVCECGFWWRAGRRGQWRAISRRHVFRALLPGLMGELSRFELTGRWPDN
jgi:hypothetical protein